ncbi:MAG TPA: AAA family ATPase [Bacteroidales bacterium]|nr:AAA family ATPase [Bacteroidales bacterium]HPU46725.1 AAA family ATPase [Bacteroidales bacterium]HPZ36052.1 AAA family ATPase [Bacteroidales bacterium]HQD34354.1 AAA family ATPase [Bacteroidales bacterium]HXK91129.1 AAA family ATPase [Bacteroidales bacterium]
MSNIATQMNVLLDRFIKSPTEDQQVAFNKLLNGFLQPTNKDNHIYMLTGAAGTGKTTIVEALVSMITYLNDCIENGLPLDIDSPKKKINLFLTATTGRAARMLENRCKFSACTIHKLIYTLDDNKSEVSRNSVKWYYKIADAITDPYSVIFIDESSMISSLNPGEDNVIFGSGNLIDDILTFGTNAKIVFVGDPYQLPPINETKTLALDPELFEMKYFYPVQFIELKEPVRFSKFSGIYQLAYQIRDNMLSNEPNNLNIEENSNITIYDNVDDLLNQHISNLKRDPTSPIIMIAYTNNVVSTLNKKIRNTLLKNNKKLLNNNEYVMVTRNNYLYDLMNGEIVQIVSVENECKKIEHLRFRKVKLQYGEDIEDEMKCMVLENTLEPNFTYTFQDELLILSFIFEKIQKEHPDLLNNKKLLMYKLQTDPYLNALRLKYAYAITCHKAQGGEWDEVSIVTESILYHSRQPSDFVNKWLYTAITRAKSNVNLLRRPARPVDFIDELNFDIHYKMGKFIPRFYTGYIHVKDMKLWTAKSGVDYVSIDSDEILLIQENNIQCDMPDSLPCYAFCKNGRIIRWQKDIDESSIE